MTKIIYYPMGNTVYKAEAEITSSGTFTRKRETEQEIARLNSTDEAYNYCEKIVGKRTKFANGIS